MNKRIVCIIIVCILAMGLSGCWGKKATPSPTPTPSPTQAAEPTKHPDLWSDTKVFGIALDITDSTLSAMVAEELRIYELTDFAKRCIKDLNIKIGDEIAVEFETDDEGKNTAKSVEKVNR